MGTLPETISLTNPFELLWLRIKEWRRWKGMDLDFPVRRGIVKDWDVIACARSSAHILESFKENPIDKARFLAAGAKYSGATLNCIPLTNLGLKLNDTQLRIATVLQRIVVPT